MVDVWYELDGWRQENQGGPCGKETWRLGRDAGPLPGVVTVTLEVDARIMQRSAVNCTRS